MVHNTAARTYARIELETGVATANPHRLILMLFDGAITATADAAAKISEQRIAEKGKAISKAIRIIEEGLKASLNLEGGGGIAESLSEMYNYMSRRLLLASMRNDVGPLEEVARLLGELRGAWADIAERSEATAAQSKSSVRQAAV